LARQTSDQFDGDQFDDETYWGILERFRRTNRPVRFVELAGGFPSEPFFILRHDVDYSPVAALRLARLEAKRGYRATYFLLLSSTCYSLLTPEAAALAPQLVELGHEVGLHYDLGVFKELPRERWDDLLRAQVLLLSRLAGAPVCSIAMHQPGLNGEDPFAAPMGFLNAYDDAFFKEMPYLSDSCRAWRDSAWEILSGGPVPPRFQAVFHPINWGPGGHDRAGIFAAAHDVAKARIENAKVVLLEQIARHPAVGEEEARAKRTRAVRKEA
jgi:hypothetical protein